MGNKGIIYKPFISFIKMVLRPRKKEGKKKREQEDKDVSLSILCIIHFFVKLLGICSFFFFSLSMCAIAVRVVEGLQERLSFNC